MKYDNSHGSPYDRGSADKWYGRSFNPHKRPDGFRSVPLETQEELDAYTAGYEENEFGKDYGHD